MYSFLYANKRMVINMIDINLNKINKSFGSEKVLVDIDITINKGEKVALIGSNGCGKTTLLKLISKNETPTSGEISIRKNTTLGYLSQVPEEQNILIKDYINDAFKNLLELKQKLEKLERKYALLQAETEVSKTAEHVLGARVSGYRALLSSLGIEDTLSPKKTKQEKYEAKNSQ